MWVHSLSEIHNPVLSLSLMSVCCLTRILRVIIVRSRCTQCEAKDTCVDNCAAYALRVCSMYASVSAGTVIRVDARSCYSDWYSNLLFRTVLIIIIMIGTHSCYSDLYWHLLFALVFTVVIQIGTHSCRIGTHNRQSDWYAHALLGLKLTVVFFE